MLSFFLEGLKGRYYTFSLPRKQYVKMRGEFLGEFLEGLLGEFLGEFLGGFLGEFLGELLGVQTPTLFLKRTKAPFSRENARLPFGRKLFRFLSTLRSVVVNEFKLICM